MKLYAVADIHGRSDRMAMIRKNLEKHRPDLLVAAGDLVTFRKVPSVLELSSFAVPVLAICGNTDPGGIESWLTQKGNVVFLRNRDTVLMGAHFAGISGALAIPFRTRIALREAPVWSRLIPLITHQTVLLAHPPPWGCQDLVRGKFHAGSKSLEKVILNCQPAMLICGHIHEDAGVDKMGRTLIVNCAMGSGSEGAIINIRNGGISAEILKN